GNLPPVSSGLARDDEGSTRGVGGQLREGSVKRGARRSNSAWWLTEGPVDDPLRFVQSRLGVQDYRWGLHEGRELPALATEARIQARNILGRLLRVVLLRSRTGDGRGRAGEPRNR